MDSIESGSNIHAAALKKRPLSALPYTMPPIASPHTLKSGINRHATIAEKFTAELILRFTLSYLPSSAQAPIDGMSTKASDPITVSGTYSSGSAMPDAAPNSSYARSDEYPLKTNSMGAATDKTEDASVAAARDSVMGSSDFNRAFHSFFGLRSFPPLRK